MPRESSEHDPHISHGRLESLLETVLDTIVDGVVTIDEYGVIQSYNRACETLFGYKADEVIGENVNILMPEPYHSEHDRYIENYKHTKEAKIIGIGREVMGRRKDGSVFPMDLAVGATDKGGNHAFVGIIRDITEEKKADAYLDQLRQAQKMEAIGQLTSGIAHDFNNLLAVVLGNLDMLMEQIPENDSLRKRVEPCIAAAEQGAELIEHLLSFGRKQSLDVEILQLNDMIFYLSTLMKRTLGANVEIITDLASELWPVELDPLQLQNAILNLAVNARDAMPDGGSLIFATENIPLERIEEQPKETLEPGDYVMLSIADTGHGMNEEMLDKVFEPFFSTKGSGKGTGLGLSMVYGFIKQSNGYIHVSSTEQKGTTMRLYFPRAYGDLAAEKPPKPYQRREVAPQSKTVLVVEDDPDVLNMTVKMVKNIGYHVLSCESGETALEFLKTHQIDVLLSDVMLTGTLNGPKLAEKALSLHPALKVLFNTGYAEQEVINSGMLPGGVLVLSKPFRQQQLAGKLREALEQ